MRHLEVSTSSKPLAFPPGDDDAASAKLLECLGEGLYSKVYRAMWRGTEVAVKVRGGVEVAVAGQRGNAHRARVIPGVLCCTVSHMPFAQASHVVIVWSCTLPKLG